MATAWIDDAQWYEDSLDEAVDEFFGKEGVLEFVHEWLFAGGRPPLTVKVDEEEEYLRLAMKRQLDLPGAHTAQAERAWEGYVHRYGPVPPEFQQTMLDALMGQGGVA